ncbi:ankyrin repeat-containing domain protein [Aspergillus coremiiformis]|uniref:Ankyrin repeat-containing domain protein n=1 Tax=Aspergillus coremiiformis TaxID=138285 RepID=A0A5N6ZFJ8_9EURO|nr:ankyrin repeat-containing domain protein [Aspergillus coremiiformis]
MGLHKLSVETIVTIIRFLNLQDVLNLRCVCRDMDRLVLRNMIYTGQVDRHLNDRLWSRLVFEEITHDVSSNENIARIISRLRLLSAEECDAEDCRQAISTALVLCKGREWLSQNIKDLIKWTDIWDEGAVMVLGAWLGLKDVVEKLLQSGVPGESTHEYLGSALYAAAFNDNEPLVALLIGHGVDAWKPQGAYGDALQLAAYMGSTNVARRLLTTRPSKETFADPFGYGPYGSPLGAAAAGGHEDIVRLCVEWQPVTRQLGPHLRTPLFYAARSGRVGVTKILLDGGELRPNFDDEFRDTPLHVAVKRNHHNVVSVLLSSDKIRLDHRRVRGGMKTPLEIAASKGYTNIVRMLLRRDVNVCQPTYKPPIFMRAIDSWK